ncbi:MAG: class I SAM-dependent methyltransferase [Chloroflexota bacterium]
MQQSDKPFGPISGCQVCEADDLRSVLFLGYLPPVNTMVPVELPAKEEGWFPAELVFCRRCRLVQLGYAVDPRILFPPDYPYTSGTTRVLRENFSNLYTEVCARVPLGPNDLVVDIGSNDGTLLGNFHAHGHRVYGIEPSLTGEIAQSRGIPTLIAFFDHDAVKLVRGEQGPAKVITATNVFAHIHNVHRVLRGVSELLAEDGVFVTESHYLLDLVETLQYDTIYHEHLRYYSLTSLLNLLERHGFRVFDVQRIPTHGGSIRVFASRSSAFARADSVDEALAVEAQAGIVSEAWIGDFRRRVTRSKLALYQLLGDVTERGAVYGIGAPSRASTLINYLGLDDAIVQCVLEVSSSRKLNKYMPGTRIPVLDEERLYQDQPPYVLLLSWHIANELCENLQHKGYKGDFIIPLPVPRIVRAHEVPLS